MVMVVVGLRRAGRTYAVVGAASYVVGLAGYVGWVAEEDGCDDWLGLLVGSSWWIGR